MKKHLNVSTAEVINGVAPVVVFLIAIFKQQNGRNI